LSIDEMQRKEHIKEIMNAYSPKERKVVRLIDLPKRCFIPRVNSSMLPNNFVIKPKVHIFNEKNFTHETIDN